MASVQMVRPNSIDATGIIQPPKSELPPRYIGTSWYKLNRQAIELTQEKTPNLGGFALAYLV